MGYYGVCGMGVQLQAAGQTMFYSRYCCSP